MPGRNDDKKTAGAENRITIELNDPSMHKNSISYSVCVDGEWLPVEPGQEITVDGGAKIKLRAEFDGPDAGAGGAAPKVTGQKPHGKRGVAFKMSLAEEKAVCNVYRGASRDALSPLAVGLKDAAFRDEFMPTGNTMYYRITASGEKPAEGQSNGAGITPAQNAGVLSRSYPEAEDWQSYVYFKPERRGEYNYDLNPVFLRRLAALAKAYLKEKLFVTWGYRTRAEQEAQHHACAAHGGKPADEPGMSWHEHRLAADIQTYTIRRLSNAMLDKFGLVKPISGNSHHIQPIETLNIPPEGRAAFAAAANAGFEFASGGTGPQTVKCPYCDCEFKT